MVTSKKFVLHYNTGNELKGQGKLEGAISAYKKAITINPNFAPAYYNMANAQQEIGDLTSSITNYQKMLKIMPNHAGAFHNMGIALYNMGDLDKAIESYNYAIEINPDHAEQYFNLGLALHDAGKFVAAIDNYEQALKLKPNYPMAYNNMGNSLQGLGDINSAGKAYSHAISLKPNYVEAKTNNSYVMLKKGDFKGGFDLMECRIQKETRYCPPITNANQYRGEAILNRHFLILTEQGVGDEIMFASMLNDLDEQGAKITLVCDPRLVSLFNRSFEFLTAIAKRPDNNYQNLEPAIDYWLLIGSLAKFYRADVNDFKKSTPYLRVDEASLNKWKKRYDSLDHPFNVGISWSGGSKQKHKKLRSLSLEKLAPVLAIANKSANIINLQYGDHQDEIGNFTKKNNIVIHDWEDADPLINLDDFSSQVKALDLVISIDNTTVHFSGALGVSTMVMLPFNSDWRWSQERQDSYWYPEIMHLVRQQSNDQWDSVIENTSDALKQYFKY